MVKKKIAFQGIKGAYSDLACNNHYPKMDSIPCETFTDVFRAVENGEADYGIIPLENSYAGRVSEIHQLLQNSKVSIVAEHFQAIEHCLAAKKGVKIENIKHVYSHQQALMQCRKSLLKIKNAELHNMSNTAVSAQFVSENDDGSKAAICSTLAAKYYGLNVVQDNMQDSVDNITVFVVIAKDGVYPDQKKGRVLTTLLFTIRNIPAALYKSLGGFATNGINMVKLESYIPGGISKQAQFFISFEGHPDDKKVNLALEELGFFSKNVKVLGIYHADPKRFE